MLSARRLSIGGSAPDGEAQPPGGCPSCTAIDAVLARAAAVYSHENPHWLRATLPSCLSNAGVLHGLGVVAGNAVPEYELLLESGKTVTVALQPDRSEPLVHALDPTRGYHLDAWRRADELYWSEYWAAHRALYIRYSLCAEMPSYPFPRFAADTLAVLDRALGGPEPLTTVIVDLRGNPGGNSAIVQPLVRGLTERSGRLASQSGFRAFVLANRYTFSSGVFAVWDFLNPGDRRESAFTYLGEPTGGKPRSYGEVRRFQPPCPAPASPTLHACGRRRPGSLTSMRSIPRSRWNGPRRTISPVTTVSLPSPSHTGCARLRLPETSS